VWVATVENIDWPSKKGLSTEEQKAEFIRLLDMNKRNGMNAIIMQIRPVADAFYPSPFEPWSEYLTGKQGVAPNPYYDPLQFMIEETHKRGMEFHAWLNPYRAVFNIYRSSVAPNHITRQHPEWFITYGDKKYFDPGQPEAMQFVAKVVKDIVSRYDLDGIHMDDYFYPYRIPGKDFPDNKTYLKYGDGLTKDEWRRSNCDSIIKLIHDVIIDTRPMVKFGISPFGVWRNKSKDPMGSDTRAGVTNYDDLYADILLWLKEGWIDYVAPQLYWEIGHPLCDYETLLNWWSKHSYGKQVFVGHGLYRSVERPTQAWRNPNELPEEITLLRETPNVSGSIFFSNKSFERNPNGWNDSLQLNYYQLPALVPPMPWVDTIAPKQPVITLAKDKVTKPDNVLQISGSANIQGETERVKSYVLYISNDVATLGTTPVVVKVADTTHQFSFNVWPSQIPEDWNNCFIAVSSVDRENNESILSSIIEYVKTNTGWALKKAENEDLYEATVSKTE
jgi:uncharacterized lipoprotein YddW (UPF0748 family)